MATAVTAATGITIEWRRVTKPDNNPGYNGGRVYNPEVTTASSCNRFNNGGNSSMAQMRTQAARSYAPGQNSGSYNNQASASR